MSNTALPAALAAAGFLFAANWLWENARRTKNGVRFPPGPPGVPLLGNLFDVPAVNSHLTYTELAKQYGLTMMHLRILNREVLVISDVEIANELLHKRGSIYSDRPPYYMADAAGWDWHAANIGHNEAWRVRRRLVHQKFYANASLELRGMVRQTTVEFLCNLLRTPDNFRHHVRRSAAANIMKAIYGITIADEGDPYVDIAEQGMEKFGQLVMPGSTPVDQLPFLLNVPEWVPYFGQWTAQARAWHKYPDDMLEVPYARTRSDISQGIAKPCMVTDNLEAALDETDEPSLTEKVLKDACAVSYIAGGDTTVSALLAFIMAMVCWPEYQQKAHEELDRVLGDRLPEFADQESLPYVEAIIRETYRKYPVTPLAMPHSLEEDDTYEGVFIQKGTTVVPNVWAMMHDESKYPDAYKFNPDRWIKGGKLNDELQDPRITGTYGFGRRICPGRHFADDSVYLTIAMSLKCFDFQIYVENGVQVPPSQEFHFGIICGPVPFKCTITPRSEASKGVINAATLLYNEENQSLTPYLYNDVMIIQPIAL